MAESRMYAEAKTWSPFKGCRFGCTYCAPSFQRQAKRQKRRCAKCYSYQPHRHVERLARIPSAEIVFVCGNADISFCDAGFTGRTLDTIRDHNERCPGKTYYLQSKRPEYFGRLLDRLSANVVLVTTLETNRDAGYGAISKAPLPSERFRQFAALDYPRKVVTIEPVMDFDVETFAGWVTAIGPEYVWLGYNSRPREVSLPEPTDSKMRALVGALRTAGIEIRAKDLRRLVVA